MKILAAEQIRQIDQLTIQTESIRSIDLMERASQKFVEQFCAIYGSGFPVCVLCGPGNNGGDGLAIARLLLTQKYNVKVFLLQTTNLSADCSINRHRLKQEFPTSIIEITDVFIAPEITHTNTIIIDSLFGSGLSRPLSGIFAEAVNWINSNSYRVVSVDIPSGMYCDENFTDNQLIVKADVTFTFQLPKLAFLLADAGEFAGSWYLLDIQLDKEAILQSKTDYYYIDEEFVKALIKKRPKFSHKGTFGHALLIAGSKGMAGASILASRAALRSGLGLLTLHAPECNRIICQTAVPELIFSADKNSEIPVAYPELKDFKTIGIGCGIGTAPETASMVEKLLTEFFASVVIDADALNIISRSKHFMDLIPENSILTPHPKEFDRLFGVQNNAWQRIQKAREMATRYRIIIILKGAHTVIVNSDGNCYFNSTGNNGLATAGTGDVLTGILTALLTQGYSSIYAACLGVYLHGLAADIALNSHSVESLIAGDIADNLGAAFKKIQSFKMNA